MSVDLVLVLQILTLLVAVVGPYLAYRYAKRLFVSGNRQQWLDELREDVSELIALNDKLFTLRHQSKEIKNTDIETKRDALNVLRDTLTQLQVVRFRIRLRLKSGNARHDNLWNSIEQMITAEDNDEVRNTRRREVVNAAEIVLQYVWAKIEKGR